MPKPETNAAAELAAIRAELDKARAELAAAQQAAAVTSRVSFKVSEKKAVSVYGLGRWPITLYAGQWDRLLSQADALRSFIADNRGRLAVKE